MSTKYIVVSFFKVFLFFGVVATTLLVFIYAYFYIDKGRAPRLLNVEPSYTSKDVVILPYTTKSYAGYGRVFEPEIDLRLKTKTGGELQLSFLLDSGAVVSTLPVELADTLGQDLTNAKRIVLRGYGNNRSFGYMSNMTIFVKDDEYDIPVVFSEGDSKQIIGRNGFFDFFTVVFDHKDKVIRLAQ